MQAAEGIQLGELTVEAQLTPEGRLRGTWHTTIGTGGTFEAYPHDVASSPAQATNTSSAPEQLYTKNIPLGSVRLFGEDVKRLIEDVRRDFITGRAVVTFNARGGEVTRYAEDFLQDARDSERLSYLKITIQEPEVYGINRVVVVELNAFGTNEVRVQGVQESWVIGKAEALAALLRRHESPLITTYKKFGLNLNQAVFLAMLVVMPGIKAWTGRALFAAAVLVLLTGMLWLHARFIPNASIRLGSARPTALGRLWPTVLSWITAATASLAAALVFYWLTKDTS